MMTMRAWLLDVDQDGFSTLHDQHRPMPVLLPLRRVAHHHPRPHPTLDDFADAVGQAVSDVKVTEPSLRLPTHREMAHRQRRQDQHSQTRLRVGSHLHRHRRRRPNLGRPRRPCTQLWSRSAAWQSGSVDGTNRRSLRPPDPDEPRNRRSLLTQACAFSGRCSYMP